MLAGLCCAMLNLGDMYSNVGDLALEFCGCSDEARRSTEIQYPFTYTQVRLNEIQTYSTTAS
eukprot:6913771-Alexandrium_andersonii.AAC.1